VDFEQHIYSTITMHVACQSVITLYYNIAVYYDTKSIPFYDPTYSFPLPDADGLYTSSGSRHHIPPKLHRYIHLYNWHLIQLRLFLSLVFQLIMKLKVRNILWMYQILFLSIFVMISFSVSALSPCYTNPPHQAELTSPNDESHIPSPYPNDGRGPTQNRAVFFQHCSIPSTRPGPQCGRNSYQSA
jgi:hypothetical protein